VLAAGPLGEYFKPSFLFKLVFCLLKVECGKY
jgi:hypothetical protein